ncbi:MAG: hypothetical protein HYZ81_21065, partial [Nitrospinae bacterium]|nr:hypothetical protein [Nitrospinota bacterium]
MRLKRPCIVLTGMLLVSLSVGIAVQPGWPLMLTAPGFDVFFPTQSGLTGVRGFVVFPSLIDFIGFHNCYYFVEQALNRVSASCGGTTVHPLATGLSTPTDIVGPPTFCGGVLVNPFGNFLYVTESGANKISRIDVTGCVPECDRAVTTFATFTSPPRRMA